MKKKATEKQHPFMKMAGIKDMNKFMEMYPTEDDFFADYPQAKYGMRIADAGLNLPGGAFGSQSQGNLSAEDASRALNASGPMGKQGGYAVKQGPVMDPTPTSDLDAEEEEQEEPIDEQQVAPQQANKKPRKKYKFDVNGGDKTWNPFAKDNAWNTGEGFKTTDMFGMAPAIASALLPYQPARMNKPFVPMGMGNYGTGSHAAFEDGGPMITNVEPSAHTYFRPMTRQGRQVPETPNFIAADGMAMTPQQRDAWNKQQVAARQQGFIGDEYSRELGNQFMQSQGMDPNQLGAYQADLLEQRNTSPWGKRPGAYMTPGTERNFSPADSHYGKDTAREMYLNYNVQGKPFGTDWKAATAYSGQLEAARQNEWQNFGKPQANINYRGADAIYPENRIAEAPTTPKPTGLAATGFPTREEAVAKYQARKASGQELPSNYFLEDTKKQKRMKESGDPIGMVRSTGEDVYAYGGPILGGFDARLNQNYPYPMTNQYPHKIGGQYHPYDHTRMEMGGIVPLGPNGLQVEKNQFKYLSPKTVEIEGKKHSNKDKNGKGGTNIAYNGNVVEAERGETFHVDNNAMELGGNMAEDGTAGSGIVGGNLIVPDTNTKFKDAFKDLAKSERKTGKLKDKASKFLNEYGSKGIGPKNKYQSPAFNYGVVMSDAYEQEDAQDSLVKKSLTDMQNKMLELGGMIDPENGAKKVSQMFKGTAKWGKKMMAANGATTPATTPTAAAGSANQYEWQQGAWYPTKKEMQAADPSWHAPETFRPMIFPAQVPPDNTYVAPRNRLPLGLPGVTSEYATNDTPINFEAPANTAAFSDEEQSDKKAKKVKGLRNKFRVTDYIPEIVAGFERADPYQSMQLQPYFGTYSNISLQNQKNAIQSAFAPAMKAANTAGEKAAIAGQMAEQLKNVDAQEFQINQQGRGNLQQDTLNEQRRIQSGNASLAQDAYEKTLGAKEAARQIRQAAGKSVSTKEKARQAKNLELGMYEDYAGWAYNPETKKKWERNHPGEIFDPRTVSLADIYDNDEKKTVKKKKKDTKGKESEEEIVITNEKYYGGPMAYFGTDMPVGIPRIYFGGGAVGGGAMAMGAGQSMQGLSGQAGFMASRYSPGGNTQNKKKKKRTT